MDQLDALDRATSEFAGRLGAVAADQWRAPTPCDDWDVRYLVAHVVGGNRFASLVLAGQAASTAIEQIMSTPQLGAAPLDDFGGSAEAQRRLFRTDGVLELDVDHPLGTIPASRLLAFRIVDLAVHAWDLAVAIDGDRDLDGALVVTVLDLIAGLPDGLGFGIEPRGLVGADAAPQPRLLDLVGRG